MVERRRSGRGLARSRGRTAAGSEEPDMYAEMLAEAGVDVVTSSGPSSRHTGDQVRERSLKRPRKGRSPHRHAAAGQHELRTPAAVQIEEKEQDEESEDLEFEDVTIPQPSVQTLERDSDSDTDDEMAFEDIDFANIPTDQPVVEQPKDLELNLSAATPPKQGAGRRKPLTREEKEHRVNIHKTHLLCLLSHASRRNNWCNDSRVQEIILPLLNDKTVDNLNPASHLNQFSRAECLKAGLKSASNTWKTNWEKHEKGMSRARWAEHVRDLEYFELPTWAEECFDRQDFRQAAKAMRGSRDIGAQLFCALMRGAGVKARLVCSLQPLTFTNSGPALPKSPARRIEETQAPLSSPSRGEQALLRSSVESPSSAALFSVHRQLGHQDVAAKNLKTTASPSQRTLSVSRPAWNVSEKRNIKESLHPIYWVEVLDIGHQKWQPVDPLVTDTICKPRAFEPPNHDRENSMSYVVAFEADGTAKDVTLRYAKAYVAKTRRSRVDGGNVDGGEDWWKRVMQMYRFKGQKQRLTDLDQIEANELNGMMEREPMPKNVQDFKDHPIFALERHLRRHEVFITDARPSGTVRAGNKGPLEKIYRRKHIRIARTGDKWYRMGREVKPNEIPAKWLPKRSRPKGHLLDSDEADEEEDPLFGGGGMNGQPIYTIDQTTLYEAPPVRNGKVPKNKFGNIDLYVPSMVPRGGVHIPSPLAARAAHLLNVDYAPALTGFSFSGRHGTAVLQGAVVPVECADAVRAAVRGYEEAERDEQQEKKRMNIARVWRRWLVALRIRERVWEGVDEDGRREEENKVDERVSRMQATEPIVSNCGDQEDDEERSGGFIAEHVEEGGKEEVMVEKEEEEEEVEEEEEEVQSETTEEMDMIVDDDDDDDMGGGFLVE